jgi:hypothetical protein
MTTYISGADATISSLQQIRKKDIFKATTGVLSLRFTSSVSTSLSMSYSATPSESLGRCYQETSSLYNFYTSIQGYGDVVTPFADHCVKSFQVSDIFSVRVALAGGDSLSTSRVVFTGANSFPHSLRHFNTSPRILNFMQAYLHSRELSNSSILGV